MLFRTDVFIILLSCSGTAYKGLPVFIAYTIVHKRGNFTGEYLSTSWKLQLSVMLQLPVDETDSSSPQWRGQGTA